MKSQISLLLVVLVGVIALEASMLQREHMPGESHRLELVSIENMTEKLEFQVYPEGKSSAGTVFPMSTLHLQHDKHKNQGVHIAGRQSVAIKCTKGSYLPVFIKDGTKASGTVPQGFEGPYTVSMWLPYQTVPEAQKVNIRYAVRKGHKGKIGVKIGTQGDYRLVAKEDIKFIH